MIISASRRTDIPAFHASWFMNCLRRGQITVKNPFNPRQERVVSLEPTEVEAIVFWTRNASSLLKHLSELDDRGYRYIFLYTITGYGPPLEKRCPPLDAAIKTFKKLSERIGPQRIIWRFDPIILIKEKGPDWIITRFEQVAQSLRGYTGQVVISFLDLYTKVMRRLVTLNETDGITIADVAGHPAFISHTVPALAFLASENKMKIYSCSEKIDLSPFGILPGSCIDAAYLNHIFGTAISPGKDKNQRPHCRCSPSHDIGTYNTCRHGCVYCYAIS